MRVLMYTYQLCDIGDLIMGYHFSGRLIAIVIMYSMTTRTILTACNYLRLPGNVLSLTDPFILKSEINAGMFKIGTLVHPDIIYELW